MTIGIVNNCLPHVGKGKYCFNLMDKLREMKKDVGMIYLESKDNPIPDMEGIAKVKQRFNLPVFNKTFSWYYYFPKRIPKGYDLYHLTSGSLCKIAKYRKPSVLIHMDVAPLHFKEYPFHMRYLVKKTLQFYNEVERIIAISERSKDELVEMGVVPGGMVDVVHIGYDENVYKPMPKEACRKRLGLPLDKKILLNVGSEEERKNVTTLLKALHILKKDLPDFLLIRIGQREGEDAGLKKGLNIKHLGGIPEEQMPLFYNAADVFPFPATYEGGIAYPPLEAMACGVPTVVTEELDVFREGSLIMKNPYDAEELAKMILEILTKPELHKKLSRAALNTAKRFTLTKEAKGTYKVYEEVLS